MYRKKNYELKFYQLDMDAKNVFVGRLVLIFGNLKLRWFLKLYLPIFLGGSRW